MLVDKSNPGDVSVRVSRWTGVDGEGITLKVEEVASGATIEIGLSFEGLARALTGMSGDGVVTRKTHMDKMGLRKTYKHVQIKADYPDYELRNEWSKQKSVELCPDGYVYSHGGFDNRGMLNLSFIKWEPAES